MATTGEVEAVELPVGYPRDAARTLRGLVEALQVVVARPEGAREWTSTEPGQEGPRAVSYRVLATDADRGEVRLARKAVGVRQRLEAATAPGMPAVSKVEVAESTGTVVWSTAGDGLVSLRFEDAEKAYAGDEVVMSGRSTLTAEVVPGDIGELPATEDEADRALADDAAARQRFYAIPPEYEAELVGLDARTIVRAFVAEVRTRPQQLMPRLKYYLRLHPQDVRAVAEAVDALSDAPGDRMIVGSAFAAIAAAGHTPAQAVLGEAIAGEGFRHPSARAHALRATLSLERPEPFLLPIAWDYVESLPRRGRNAAYFLSEATNLFGALGAVDRGVPANTRAVVETLGRALRGARTDADRYRALVALSNTGDLERCLPLVEPYFASPRESLRDAAFEIYRKVPGEAAFEAFARRYAAETSPAVRRAASEVAVAMPDTAARSAWAAREALRESDTLVLDRQVRILGDAMASRPENARALHRLLGRVAERSVRKTIYRYVGPDGTGGAR